MSRLDRITTDPEICHGKAVIRGLRYPVSLILELLAAGESEAQLLSEYPDLEHEDILAALEFGALLADGRRVVPLANA